MLNLTREVMNLTCLLVVVRHAYSVNRDSVSAIPLQGLLGLGLCRLPLLQPSPVLCPCMPRLLEPYKVEGIDGYHMDDLRPLSGGYASAPTLNVQIQGMHGQLIR